MKPLFDPSVTDVKTTLVNLSNSILKHYGHETFHATIPEFDNLFKGHRKIAVFLFDGMGEAILRKHPFAGKSFLKHGFFTIHSVNPATTVAATTAFLTAKFPIETGWVGWSQQFDNYGLPIDCFRGTSSIDKAKVEGFSMDEECPVTRLDQLLGEVGVKAKLSYPFPLSEEGAKDYREISAKAEAFFRGGGEFLYSYWKEPDHIMHEYGTESIRAGILIHKLKRAVERFARRNPDVLCLVIADHGQLDVQFRDFAAIDELRDSIRKPMSLDGRCRSFFVAEGYEDTFVPLMEKNFPDYVLMTADEAIEAQFFGEGTPHPRIKEFLGDYVGTTSGNGYIYDSIRKKNNHILIGHHAGIHKDEKDILVSVFNN
ncbi:MAG: hypothetical protein K6F32_07795 [Bacilli bacterium]|nr:hypothetical protein [Bacilli bacterium]